jgi:6-phosphogluconolactonase (cycloisomerase 2 family)
MWVLGTYYNQISGFLIDDYSGNLTAITHSPFSSGGTTPVTALVKPGGRFLFVINQGSGIQGVPGSGNFTSPGESIAVFSVGGGGTLTFEQSYDVNGAFPVWGTLDSSGNYLYVAAKYSPAYCPTVGGCKVCPQPYTPGNCPSSALVTEPYDVNGAITAWSIDGSTGRLQLVTNNSILTNQIPQTYFEIGPNPIMTKIGSGSCLFTLEPNAIYPYAVNSSNGQLTTVTTGAYQVTGSNTLTSMNTSTGSSASSYIYLTDGPGNQIFSLQAGGTACSLQPISGSQQTNLSGTYNPVNSLTSSSGKFLYVLNNSATATPLPNANSTISAFTINSQGQIATLADSTNNPYAVGSGPTCIVQDPSNQYMYITDQNDSTVTGKLLDQNRGYLSDLARGSVFTVTMKPTCMAVSGNL